MLVLTRKLQEHIRIGDNITVTVLRVKGNTVRLGIAAPDDVRVVRGELTPQTISPAVNVERLNTAPAAPARVSDSSRPGALRAPLREIVRSCLVRIEEGELTSTVVPAASH